MLAICGASAFPLTTERSKSAEKLQPDFCLFMCLSLEQDSKSEGTGHNAGYSRRLSLWPSRLVATRQNYRPNPSGHSECGVPCAATAEPLYPALLAQDPVHRDLPNKLHVLGRLANLHVQSKSAGMMFHKISRYQILPKTILSCS